MRWTRAASLRSSGRKSGRISLQIASPSRDLSPADPPFLHQQPVQRKRSGATNQNSQSDGDSQKVILISLALLLAVPVHEKAERRMPRRDGHHHVAQDSESGDARQQADDKSETAEELRCNHQKSKRRWNPLAREEGHGALEAPAAEPARHLLGAVRENDNAEHHPQQCQNEVIVCADQHVKHLSLLLSSRNKKPGYLNISFSFSVSAGSSLKIS